MQNFGKADNEGNTLTVPRKKAVFHVLSQSTLSHRYCITDDCFNPKAFQGVFEVTQGKLVLIYSQYKAAGRWFLDSHCELSSLFPFETKKGKYLQADLKSKQNINLSHSSFLRDPFSFCVSQNQNSRHTPLHPMLQIFHLKLLTSLHTFLTSF